MPLQLPNLDDRRYADLVEEALSLIPTYAPEWTNHNPSDPGIMLIELFAYLSEMLIYRLNRVTDDNLRKFLKLLNGPDWQQQLELKEEVQLAVLGVRKHYRAVTCEDYEALALAKEASTQVVRAKCVPQRCLDANIEKQRVTYRPGHISVIIVPRSTDPAPQPSEELRKTVWNYLDPRRILTTRLHVAGPVYVPVSAEILIARRADVLDEHLRGQVEHELNDFLRGGPDGKGWPFGRDIYVSELYELLEGIQGVDYVPDIVLFSQCPPDDIHCAAASELWHEDGNLMGLDLAAHHLPRAQINPARIVISAAFVPMHVTIQVLAAESVAPKEVCSAINSAVKRFLHPLHGGPDGMGEQGILLDSIRTLVLDSIRTLVRNSSNIEIVVSVDVASDPQRLLWDEKHHNVKGVLIKARELLDVEVTVKLG